MTYRVHKIIPDILLLLILMMGSSQSGTKESTAPISSPVANISDTGFVNRANFGAGCYWGTEKYFKKDFPKLGKGDIINGKVGFMGPSSSPANPSYRQVCSGITGHVEVYDFEYTGGAETYRELVKFFFRFHDPTTFNAQGNDRGTQYASVIYTYSPDQAVIANEVISELQQLLDAGKVTAYNGKKVTTEVRTATVFYPAEEDHQEYLFKNPGGYCNHRIRFQEWPSL